MSMADRSPDVVSRENKVVLGFMTLALALLIVVGQFSGLPAWVGGAVLLGVGVVCPIAVNEYLDGQAE